MKDVFISYRREPGKEYAEKLYEYLNEKSRGLRVYYDKVDMKDGKTFPPQLEAAVREAPNYVLIATQNVFTHGKEERDWVWKEIEIALDEYKKNPLERTLTVLVPSGVEIPARETLPEEIQDIADVQRIGERTDTIELPFGHNWYEEFHRVFQAVTELNRRNLWFGAHRWYENAYREGGRFSSLRIDETIMPFTSEIRPHAELPIRVFMEDQKTDTKPLLNALSSSDGHLYLIGQGGIGKTTALMHIMKQAYDKKTYAENAQIPIFVDLSYAPDSAFDQIYANGKSTFIRRAIFRQVRAERSFRIFGDIEVETLTDLFGLPYDLAVRPIVDLLRQESPAPEYLLLLDGLNEVSTQTVEAVLDDGGKIKATVYGMIREEIIWLIENCPNVRIVLTSRADESAIYEKITKLYLSEIDETVVLEYLRNAEIDGKKIEDAEIERISSDTELMNVLRVPLFLTMYATLHDKNEATAAGEILRVFFNERRREFPDHTVKDHLVQIEKNVISDSADFLEGRITADMYDFILDFILPEIAWRLERKGEFLFPAREIRDIIMPILKERDELAICGDFGQEAFTSFCSSNPEDNTASTAGKLLVLATDESKVNRMILGICVNVLGILHFTDNKFGFVHQHIRDYFAAVKNVNTMRLSVYMFKEGEKELAIECMNRVFRDEPINLSVRRFMGEYLGEHKNKPVFTEGHWINNEPSKSSDQHLLHNTLDIYRGRANDNKDSYDLYSIIQILKEVRHDLSECDFSFLDLKGITFYGCKLGNDSFSASFYESFLYPESFFPPEIDHVVFCYVVQSKYIMLGWNRTRYSNAGEELLGCICFLDINTFSLVENIEIKKKIVSVDITREKDNCFVAIELNDKTICVLNCKSLNLVATIKGEAPVYSFDGKFLYCRQGKNSIAKYDTNDFSFDTINIGMDISLSNFTICSDNHYLCLYEYGKAKYYSIDKNQLRFLRKINCEGIIYSKKSTICIFISVGDKAIFVFDFIKSAVVKRIDIDGVDYEDHYTLSWSPDEKYFCLRRKTILQIWDSKDYSLIQELHFNNMSPNSIAWNAGQIVIICTELSFARRRIIRKYNLFSGQCIDNKCIYFSHNNHYSFSPDNRYLSIVVDEHEVQILDIQKKIIQRMYDNEEMVLATLLSNNELVFLSSNRMLFYDFIKEKEINIIPLKTKGWIQDIFYSIDLKHIIITRIFGGKKTDILTLDGIRQCTIKGLVEYPLEIESNESIIHSITKDYPLIVYEDSMRTVYDPLSVLQMIYREKEEHLPAGGWWSCFSLDGTTAIYNTLEKTYLVKANNIIEKLSIIPGLSVLNVDLRFLKNNSVFSMREKEILCQYGAIID